MGASAGVGAGLFTLGLGAPFWSGHEEGSLRGLEIFQQGYPRGLFFRQAEVEARRGNLSYEEWEKRYLPLNGIVGKVLDEVNEYAGKYDNLTFLLRYKENNPCKAVLLHYHGAGRRATDTITDFFAGHWLYYAGTNLTRQVGASSSETILHVTDTSVFSLDRVQGVGDDIAIARVGDDGTPDWESAEQVRLEEIDAENNTITVQRGAYGTEPRYFPESSYLAAHVLTAPYPSDGTPERNVSLWSYNFSTGGPRDARGRNGGDALVDYLAGKLGPGGPLASLDGIVFDVFSFGVRNGHPVVDVDEDTDGVADGGITEGIDVVGLGTIEFMEALRERLPDKIIMADGQKPDKLQRGFGYLNGIESEGFPDIDDVELDHLSRGMNIFNFWKENSSAPSANYMSFKYVDRESGEPRNTFEEPNLSENQSYSKLRLALASAQFTDAIFTYPQDWEPPETLWERENIMVQVFDELWQGMEQNPNWLGMPLDTTVYLAAEAPDLLRGQGESWPQDFVESMRSEEVVFTRDASSGIIVEPTSSDTDTPVLEKEMAFTLPEIHVPGEDLFVSLRLRVDPLEGYPASIGRRVNVTATPDGETDRATEEFTWASENLFTATFYFEDVGPGPVELSFRVEGDRPVFFEKLSAHSASGAMYREFENGAVFANPCTRPYTFDLRQLFPGASFRRLESSENQDTQANDSQPLGEELTLGPKDGLFVVRSGG